jgi:CheY-like chemotaxis protein
MGQTKPTILVVGATGKFARHVVPELLRRNALVRALKNWQVHEASNGVRGIELMKRLSPRLVLLDLLMPEMDGFETLSEMQRIPELQNIPVVVVTSKDLSANELNWLRDRAVAVVAKGANSRSQLVEALERQISARDPVGAGIGHA